MNARPKRNPLLDVTHEDRNDMQLLMSEIDLQPGRLKEVLAELVLNRKIVSWARRYRDRFPPALHRVLDTLAGRSEIRRLAPDSREEIADYVLDDHGHHGTRLE